MYYFTDFLVCISIAPRNNVCQSIKPNQTDTAKLMYMVIARFGGRREWDLVRKSEVFMMYKSQVNEVEEIKQWLVKSREVEYSI